MTKKDFDYSAAKQELDQILEWFERGEADLDKAVTNYERAESLIKSIEAYLKDVDAKLKISIKK